MYKRQGQVYPKQPLDNNSVIKLIYNEAAGKWRLDTGTTSIQQPEHVTITYDKNFTLDDGEEKDFVITYKVDNEQGTKSKGTVKVIYTISWKYAGAY